MTNILNKKLSLLFFLNVIMLIDGFFNNILEFLNQLMLFCSIVFLLLIVSIKYIYCILETI